MFPVVLFFMDFFGKKDPQGTSHRIQQATADITSCCRKRRQPVGEVRFVREPYEIALGFERTGRQNFDANMKSVRLMGTLLPTVCVQHPEPG